MKLPAIGLALFAATLAAASAQPPTAPSGPAPLYWQAPDSRPAYAAGPRKTTDGRDYVPVYDDASSAPPSTPASGRGRILYYRNPMGLADISPVPKRDSMNMEYLPVYENEAADGGVVTVPAGRLQTLGVRTAPVEQRTSLIRTIRATGTLQFDERQIAVVATRVGGWVEKLVVAATGDPVRRGQVMAQLYSPELTASEEEYLLASRLGGGLAAASLRRLGALGVPEAEIARLRRTRRALQRIPVLAPADGVVVERMVAEGARVGPDQPLYQTASLSPVWLIAEVQEQDLGAIQLGGTARASFVAFPGRTFEGKVEFIYPSLDANTRTVRVRILVLNTDHSLRAGMYAGVEIDAGSGAASGPVLAVPASAVLDSGTRQTVLVERGKGRFEPRRVRIGARGDGMAEVLDGLEAGERVVVGANFLIDAESNLRAALQSFTAPEPRKSP